MWQSRIGISMFVAAFGTRVHAASVGIALAVSAIACPAATVTFFDDFNRANGAVGNGWLNATGNAPGSSLAISSGALTTSAPYLASGVLGIYRPVGLSAPVSFSGTISQENGGNGLQSRFDTSVLFGGDGSLNNGYGLYFSRSDQNYTNSAVSVMLNGTILESCNAPSSMQFTGAISVSFTLNPLDGSISASVTQTANGLQSFTCTFGPRAVTLTGGYIGINVGLPGATHPELTILPTVDDVTISYTSTIGTTLACPNAPKTITVDQSRDYQNLASGGLYGASVSNQKTELDGSTSAEVVFRPNPITTNIGLGVYRRVLTDGIPFDLQLCYDSTLPGCKAMQYATPGIKVTHTTNSFSGDFVAPGYYPTYRVNWCSAGSQIFVAERSLQATEFLLYKAMQDTLLGLFPGSARVVSIVAVAQFWAALGAIPVFQPVFNDLAMALQPGLSPQSRAQIFLRLATDFFAAITDSPQILDYVQDAVTKYVIDVGPAGTHQFTKATARKLITQTFAALDLAKLGLAAGFLDINVGFTQPIIQINAQ